MVDCISQEPRQAADQSHAHYAKERKPRPRVLRRLHRSRVAQKHPADGALVLGNPRVLMAEQSAAPASHFLHGVLDPRPEKNRQERLG